MGFVQDDQDVIAAVAAAVGDDREDDDADSQIGTGGPLSQLEQSGTH